MLHPPSAQFDPPHRVPYTEELRLDGALVAPFSIVSGMWLTILLTIIHILVCAFLIIVVLLQSGKAADLAGAFGGMGSQTAFGPRGAATVLSRATTVAAILFMVTSLSLAILATQTSGVGTTVLETGAAKSAPAAPAKSPKPATSKPLTGQPAAPAPQK
jgi:preprotein translocase subunit SecG